MQDLTPASQVTQWNCSAADGEQLETLRIVPRAGFETVVRLARPPASVAVAALGRSSRTLSRSLSRSKPIATAGRR